MILNNLIIYYVKKLIDIPYIITSNKKIVIIYGRLPIQNKIRYNFGKVISKLTSGGENSESEMESLKEQADFFGVKGDNAPSEQGEPADNDILFREIIFKETYSGRILRIHASCTSRPKELKKEKEVEEDIKKNGKAGKRRDHH